MFVCELGLSECDWNFVDGEKNEEGKIGVGLVHWGCEGSMFFLCPDPWDNGGD